jgi:class 3 adenylate cyclase
VRIGVNSGSIVAGIVGTKSLPMISGDTVNIASRMESNSVTGKINISEKHFQLVKIILLANTEGNSSKKQGMMKMYFVENIINNLGFIL